MLVSVFENNKLFKLFWKSNDWKVKLNFKKGISVPSVQQMFD